MEERERKREALCERNSGTPGTRVGTRLGTLREEGAQLLSAADEAIEKALSRDSERFLSSTRQEGGQ